MYSSALMRSTCRNPEISSLEDFWSCIEICDWETGIFWKRLLAWWDSLSLLHLSQEVLLVYSCLRRRHSLHLIIVNNGYLIWYSERVRWLTSLLCSFAFWEGSEIWTAALFPYSSRLTPSNFNDTFDNTKLHHIHLNINTGSEDESSFMLKTWDPRCAGFSSSTTARRRSMNRSKDGPQNRHNLNWEDMQLYQGILSLLNITFATLRSPHNEVQDASDKAATAGNISRAPESDQCKSFGCLPR